MSGTGNDDSTTMNFGSHKARAAAKLARMQRRVDRELGITPHLISLCADTAEARSRLNLDRGRADGDQPPNVRRRSSTYKDREAFPNGVAAFLDDRPDTEAALRDLIADTNTFWDEADLGVVASLADRLVDHARRSGRGVDAPDYERWLRSAIEIGIARTPRDGSATSPLILPTRADFLQFSGLRHQTLINIEHEVGRPDVAVTLMITAMDEAIRAGLLAPPTGILAGTTHRYSGRGSHELGRVATFPTEEDRAEGRGRSRETIFHVIRTVPYFATESRDGKQALLRALTLPLVTPADLANLNSTDPRQRLRVAEWLRGLDLDEMVETGALSATLQQALAARRAHEAYVALDHRRLPILLPVMRLEYTRASKTHQSPLGDYQREMPGNTIADLNGLRRILGQTTRLWLAQTGVEDAGEGRVLAEPEWAARLADDWFVTGREVIERNTDASWEAVGGSAGELAVDELKYPIALRRHDPRHDVVLLRARGARDLSTGSRPTIYMICPVSLRETAADAELVCEFLRRVHGARDLAIALRDARTAAVSKPEQILGAQPKAPTQFLARELERQLLALGRLLRR